MRITTKIKNIDKNMRAEICVKIERNDAGDLLLRSALYEAILRAMRDTDKKSFYSAMASFAEEDFVNAMEWLSNEDEDNDEE